MPTPEEEAAISGGASPDSVITAFIPVLPTVVQLTGGLQHVIISDLTVAHASEGAEGPAARETSYYISSAAVQLDAVMDVVLDQIRITLAGASGLLLTDSAASNIEVTQAEITSVGGEALSVGLSASGVQNVWIHDSVFNDTGRVFMMQPAIVRLRGAANISLEHCDVGFGSYGGVLVGWQRGLPTPGQNAPIDPVFVVRANRIHDFGLGILSDFGGVYISSDNNVCFQKSPDACATPTLVDSNVITLGKHFSYGSNGVYMDEQVSAVNITRNLITDIGHTGIYNHCGNDHFESNNLLIRLARQNGGQYLGSCNSGGNPTWPNLPHGFSFTRSVVVVDPAGGPLTRDRDYRATVFNDNVYWSADGNSASHLLVFAGNLSWAAWRATGNDTNSVIADPLLSDPVAGNYTLLPGSPALARGFQQLPYANAGPRAKV